MCERTKEMHHSRAWRNLEPLSPNILSQMVPLTRTRRLTRDEDDLSDKDVAQKENIDSEKKSSRYKDDSDTLKYKQEQTRLCLQLQLCRSLLPRLWLTLNGPPSCVHSDNLSRLVIYSFKIRRPPTKLRISRRLTVTRQAVLFPIKQI